jgi:hypothetical protein
VGENEMTDIRYRKGDRKFPEDLIETKEEGDEVTDTNEEEINERFPNKKAIDEKFEDFLFELCAHIQVVGGVGNPDTFRKTSLEDAYKHLYPNNIIIGFRNTRMRAEYQISRQMLGGI